MRWTRLPINHRVCLLEAILQTPYTGPYRVLARGDKTFTTDYSGKEETVSIDRLKPAHTDSEVPVQMAQPP